MQRNWTFRVVDKLQQCQTGLVKYIFNMGVFPKIGKTPKWMVKIMENPINPWDDLGGFYPLFSETSTHENLESPFEYVTCGPWTNHHQFIPKWILVSLLFTMICLLACRNDPQVLRVHLLPGTRRCSRLRLRDPERRVSALEGFRPKKPQVSKVKFRREQFRIHR